MLREVRGPNCEVVSSTFDEPASRHIQVSQMVLEKAKRLVVKQSSGITVARIGIELLVGNSVPASSVCGRVLIKAPRKVIKNPKSTPNQAIPNVGISLPRLKSSIKVAKANNKMSEKTLKLTISTFLMGFRKKKGKISKNSAIKAKPNQIKPTTK